MPFLLALVAAVAHRRRWPCVRARRRGRCCPPRASSPIQIALGTSEPAVPVDRGRRVRGGRRSSGSRCGRRGRRHSERVPLGDGAGARAGATAPRARGSGRGRDRRGRGCRRPAAFAAPAAPRYVLRDVVIPPFDVRAYPSPLQSLPRLRARLRRRAAVHGLRPARRAPACGSRRWTPTPAPSTTSRTAAPDPRAPSCRSAPTCRPSAEAPRRRCTSRSAALTGVWMPEVGAVTQVDFAGDRPMTCDARRTTTRRRRPRS